MDALEKLQQKSRLRHQGYYRPDNEGVAAEKVEVKPPPKVPVRHSTRMKRAEEFEVKMMGLILKADGLAPRKRGRKSQGHTKKAATILRKVKKADRKPAKQVDFSKVRLAAAGGRKNRVQP